MTNKTSTYAVQFAKSKVGQAYWMGTFGQKCSYNLLAEKKRAYPQYYDQSKYSVKFTDQIQAGLKCCDCSGLFKWVIWSNSIEDDTPTYNKIPGTDLSANGMIENGCTRVGDIKDLPEVPGLLLWKNSHVAMYIGNGLCVEARGHDWGIVISEISRRNFQKFGYFKWFDYSEPAPTPTSTCTVELPVLRKGDKNSTVKTIQTMLNYLGYKDQNGNRLEVDGSFGSKTDSAVRSFQTKKGLTVDGIVGAKSWKLLLT